MKVYAVIVEEEKPKLLVWPSQKTFMKTENWCDAKFVRVCTTSELKMYEDAERKTMIVHSDIEKQAHTLLHEAYNKTLK